MLLPELAGGPSRLRCVATQLNGAPRASVTHHRSRRLLVETARRAEAHSSSLRRGRRCRSPPSRRLQQRSVYLHHPCLLVPPERPPPASSPSRVNSDTALRRALAILTTLGPGSGVDAAAATDQAVALPRRISPSAIDRYWRCPCAVWLQYVARVMRRERMSPVLVVGNAVHTALDKVFWLAVLVRKPAKPVLHRCLRSAWANHRKTARLRRLMRTSRPRFCAVLDSLRLSPRLPAWSSGISATSLR